MPPKTITRIKEQLGQSPSHPPQNKPTRLISLEEAIDLAQSMVNKYIPQNVSLADELILDRKNEAKHD